MSAELTNRSRIDVVMPLYNRCRYVGTAVRSVLEQEGRRTVIVAKDGSTEGGAERREFLASGVACRCIHPDPNSGVSAARSRRARGTMAEYVAVRAINEPCFATPQQRLAAPPSARNRAAVKRFSLR